MISADDVRVAYPLFQEEGGGSIPTSALQLHVAEISVETAIKLNMAWHSRLPKVIASNIIRNKRYVCYGASFNGIYYASAIWSSPVAANRMKDGDRCLELRRMAISDDAPKNTASRMIRIMRAQIQASMPEIARLVSYQDTEVHTGIIYKASGWLPSTRTNGMSWTTDTRTRNVEQTLAPKIRWEYKLKEQS